MVNNQIIDIMDWTFILGCCVSFAAGFLTKDLFELIFDQKQMSDEEWEEEQKKRGNIKDDSQTSN